MVPAGITPPLATALPGPQVVMRMFVLPLGGAPTAAFAPIVAPSLVPWGEKAFGNYLGPDRSRWAEWDASELLKRGNRFPGSLLVDQGLDDQFLAAQLRPDSLEAAAASSGQELVLRRHERYDHSYWFIQSFIEDHLKWHADRLCV